MAFRWPWNNEERSLTSGLMNPAGFLFDAFDASTSVSAGTRVSTDSALGLSPVWAAVKLISEDVGQLPFKVYRDTGDGEKEEARQHRSWRLLHDRPNSYTPAGRFWATVAVHLLLWGNAFIEKRRDATSGLVDELWLLPPNDVGVKWWPNLRQKTYVYTPSDMSGPKVELDDDQVLHIFGMSLDGLVGLSVIDACRQSLGTAIARNEFEGEFYKNGAVLSGVVEMQGRIRSDDALKRFKESFKALYTGSGRRHGIPVLEDGATLHTVGSPMRDLDFVASQNMSRTDIAVMFNLQPNELGGSSGESLTYATVEMNQTARATRAIAPLAKTISDAVSQDPSLLPQNVMTAEFVLEAMMRADAKSRGEFYKALSDVKAITADEIRKRENMPALTAEQKRELNPAPAVQPQSDQSPMQPGQSMMDQPAVPMRLSAISGG